jgi:hypothetical protein
MGKDLANTCSIKCGSTGSIIIFSIGSILPRLSLWIRHWQSADVHIRRLRTSLEVGTSGREGRPLYAERIWGFTPQKVLKTCSLTLYEYSQWTCFFKSKRSFRRSHHACHDDYGGNCLLQTHESCCFHMLYI